MRKIIYIAITYIICCILKTEHIWPWFVSALLFVSFFKLENSFLWEIPLATLFCNIFEIAFPEDTRMLIYVLVLVSTLVISIVSPKKLAILFPIIIFSVFVENIYAIASLWAIVWYGMRTVFCYFTTKQMNLQEHKLQYGKNQMKNC